MFGKLKSGSLISASWQIVKSDKRYLGSQLLSVLVSLTLFFAGALVVLNIGTLETVSNNGELESLSFSMHPVGTALAIIVMFGMYLITEFVGAYIFVLALSKFRDQPISSREAIAKVKSRSKGLILFSITSATIGLVLNLLQERIPFLGGKIIAWLGQVAWSIASIFGVAVIVDKKQDNPLKAVKESSSIIRKTFGDNIKADLGLGAVLLIGIMSSALIALVVSVLTYAFGLSDMVSTIIIGSFGVLSIFTIAILCATMSNIIKAAIYEYATSGIAPEKFNSKMFEQAITRKKAKKIFSRA